MQSIEIPVLYVRDGDAYIPAAVDAIALAAAHVRRIRRGTKLNTPMGAAAYLLAAYGDRKSEVFGVIALDAGHRLIETRELFYGTVDSSAVHPREVVKFALEANAAAVILFHNHPSGNPAASAADERITHILKDSLKHVDVRVLDHLIVGDTVTSMVNLGLI